MRNLDWEIVRVLYEKGSMTKAAEALYLTQSALTKRIRAMEDEWGVELVKRSSRGVIFTDNGKYLAKKAQIICDFMNEIRAHFSEERDAREVLRLGVPNSFARLHLPGLLKAYTESSDRVVVKTVPNTSDLLMQQLTEGSLDAAFICGDYTFLGDKACVLDEHLYVLAPRGTKMDDLANMPLIESYLNPMVQLVIDQWWKAQFGNLPHSTQRVTNMDIAIQMVVNGLGACFLFGAQWMIDEEKTQLIPVYDKYGEQVSRKVWLMWNDACFRSQDVLDFLEFTKDYFRKENP